ncbi:MAG: type I methionyl aminopeptidase [Candidatus Marinimicrobia bacterium]|nr:type I methionyl aminopeptidase [Candidatus Neomarinimicrobiota bacterium]
MIFLKNKDELKSIDYACKIVRDTLFHLEEKIALDITPLDLDRIAEEYIISKGAIPGFKGLYGFPSTLCVSIEDEVVHGVPSNRKLKDGEIVSIDVGSIYNEFYGDHAKTFCIGKVSESRKKLVEVTKKSLMLGIEEVKPGNHIGDIGFAVQNYAEKNNFSVVRELVGHGIGRKLHEEPQIPNYGNKNTGAELKEGMCLAIEPMLNEGTEKIITKEDGWTICTEDGKPSAHFEHTVAVTNKGVEILTK